MDWKGKKVGGGEGEILPSRFSISSLTCLPKIGERGVRRDWYITHRRFVVVSERGNRNSKGG